MLPSNAARQTRIAALQAKLKARKGNPAYAENCKHIEAEIGRLQDLNAAMDLASEEPGEPE